MSHLFLKKCNIVIQWNIIQPYGPMKLQYGLTSKLYAKLKNSGTKDHILHDSIYIKCLE